VFTSMRNKTVTLETISGDAIAITLATAPAPPD
jgi:hypothetical protein